MVPVSSNAADEEERFENAVDSAVERYQDGADLLVAVEQAATKHGVRSQMGDVYVEASEEVDRDV